MVYDNVMNALMILITQGFLGSYVMMLTEFREPVWKWKLRWYVVLSLVVGANILLILCCDFWQIYTRVGILTVTLPYVATTLWCSRFKGLRVVFNICTCLWLGCIGNANGTLAHALLPENTWIHTLVRGVSYLALYFVVRNFRPYYLQMLRFLDRGWGVLCLIPTTTFLVTIYLINHLLQASPLPIAIVIYGVAVICTCSYCLMYLFFIRVQKEYELKNSQELMRVQIAALERQWDANKKTEEAMRIGRHDMRHQWMKLSALVEQGDKQAILDLIGAAQRGLDETDAKQWCQNPTLNAMFAFYFSLAEREGITVESKLAIPSQLPVDAAELSMVFANALKNAIKAAAALPNGNRKILCRCIDRPRLMLQVENTYAGDISFDSEGLPVSAEPGHGIGTRSIVAFCKKYDAFWEYQAEDGWFRLRISL